MICRLCQSDSCAPFAEDKKRSYVRCGQCGLVFVPQAQLLSPLAEKQRYQQHNNELNNQGYVDYLSTIVADVKNIPVREPRLLDFGSGKNCVLEHLLRCEGFQCDSFDPVFGIGEECIGNIYDIVVACEVVEHVRDLQAVLKQWKQILDTAGYIIVQTNVIPSSVQFVSWWYVQDQTHVNFFSHDTLGIMAKWLGRSMKILDSQKRVLFEPLKASIAD